MPEGLLRINTLNTAADSVLCVGLAHVAQTASHGVANSRKAAQSLGKMSNQLREPVAQLPPGRDGHRAAHVHARPSTAGQKNRRVKERRAESGQR